jgi:hypothetical protein
MRNKILLSLATVGILVLSVSSVLAAPVDAGTTTKNTSQNKQLRQEIQAAVEAGDYNTWQQLIAQTPKGSELLTKINADNFPQFVQAHQLVKEGKFEDAKAIYEQLGVTSVYPGRAKLLDWKAIVAAIDSGDYQTFVSLIKDKPLGQKILAVINADNFSKLAEIHQDIKNHDFAAAKQIATELGLPKLGQLWYYGRQHGLNSPTNSNAPQNSSAS